MKKIYTFILAAVVAFSASAQSPYFSLGKSLEIQSSILRHLSSSYVDTLDFEKLIGTGIDAMLESLDPYTVYFPEDEDENIQLMTTGIYGGIGSLIKKRPGGGVVISEPYPNSPAVKAGLQPGDTILSIDGKDVYDETSQQSSDRMKGQPGTTVRFHVKKGRTGELVDLNIKRERIHLDKIEYFGMLNDSVGYIYLTGFTSGVSTEVRETLANLKQQGARKLVLDLRGNGGGLMDEAIKILSIFVPKGTMVVSSKGREVTSNVEYRTKSEPMDIDIPILVMIDNASASASEIVAGALQDLDRATIAGTRSFGKGLIQSVRPTSFGGNVKITTGKYYTPSGRCVQAIDYSHRNEDGSVGYIPDSLTHEFRTAGGRIVKDGGGITPDIEVKGRKYSRPSYSLVYGDITGDYAIKYYKEHPTIAPVGQFCLTDEEYEDFVAFCEKVDFDWRSGSEAEIAKLVEVAQYDGIYDRCKDEIDALKAKLDISKADALRMVKDEIKPLLESEIAVKYYFQAAGVQVNLRTDTQLQEALARF
ncbi:MAG: S41 family peptidase [Bacteroidales bacterium]|nr:S41 family peptidase [Bacteroidales bacterium]